MSKWYINAGPDNDVAISVRIRLARNIAGFPFPIRLDIAQKRRINELVRDAVINDKDMNTDNYRYIEMDQLTTAEAYAMVERHIISPDFAENREGRALLLLNDESVSIMLNEEDHIRLQVMTPGLSLHEAYEMADKIDGILDKKIQCAFDEKLGYLTQCPTNLGTGMRASIMLHLPALEACGAVNQLSTTVSKIGLTLRGTFGEGSQAKGAMYQLSNQVTLGISEQAAIENLKSITEQVMEKERNARQSFLLREVLEDKVWRAYGVLKNARLLSGEEFMDLISAVRLGVCLSILNHIKLETVNELIATAGAANLQTRAGETLEPTVRDRQRAEYIREKL
ncbi:MAG: protein arginine kinase [Clostridiales bacterium 43-6]|nr:MAG: protein arginine kinase [Clostridiales bacterium 43-6]